LDDERFPIRKEDFDRVLSKKSVTEEDVRSILKKAGEIFPAGLFVLSYKVNEMDKRGLNFVTDYQVIVSYDTMKRVDLNDEPL
jgi:hypothetical protein